jgi:hypothetical protein
MNTHDPIFDAIEAHRLACAATRAAFENHSAVENELTAGAQVLAARLKMIHNGLPSMLQWQRR